MKKTLLFTCSLVAAVLANAQAPTFKWAKKIGGTSQDVGSSIAVDGSGNVYTSGIFTGTVDFDPGTGTSNLTSAGNTDVFISKLNASGNFVWAKKMGGSLADGGKSVIDASGNIYTAGRFMGTADFDPDPSASYNLTSAGDSDIFVTKLNSSGNFVWAKSMGGTTADAPWNLTVDASGNVYTTGYFTGTADFDPDVTATSNLTSAGGWDIFVSKLDASGNFVLARSMGGTSKDLGKYIAVDGSGNVYSTGFLKGTADFDPDPSVTYNLTSAGGSDTYISKLDASGNFVWAKRLGGNGANEASQSFVLDESANVYTIGGFQGTADFDPGTGTYNLTEAGGSDVFISKLDGSGNFVWAKRMGSSNYEWGYGIALDGSGNVYTNGFFTGTTDFDPGTGTYNLTPTGEYDMFISKLSASGNFVWAQNFGGRSAQTEGYGITVDGYGNIYTTGKFSGTVDFDVSKSRATLTSASGSNDVFILKISQASGFMIASTDLNENSPTSTFSIYPNPNNGLFNVMVRNATNNSTIEIYNSIGTLVYKQEGKNELNSIDLTDKANGLYFVKVLGDNQIITSQKIIKQ